MKQGLQRTCFCTLSHQVLFSNPMKNSHKGWRSNTSQMLLSQPALLPAKCVARTSHSQPFSRVPVVQVWQEGQASQPLKLITESLSPCPQIIKIGLCWTKGQNLQQVVYQASFFSHWSSSQIQPPLKQVKRLVSTGTAEPDPATTSYFHRVAAVW